MLHLMLENVSRAVTNLLKTIISALIDRGQTFVRNRLIYGSFSDTKLYVISLVLFMSFTFLGAIKMAANGIDKTRYKRLQYVIRI